MLHQCRTGGGSTKRFHANVISSEALPAKSRGSFNRDALLTGKREDGSFVIFRLLIEKFPAGHGDDARIDTFAGELFRGLNGDVEFSSGGNDNDLVAGAGEVLEHVSALGDGFGGGAGLGGGDAIAAQAQDTRAGTILHRNLIGPDGLDSVTRTNSQQVGRSAKHGENLIKIIFCSKALICCFKNVLKQIYHNLFFNLNRLMSWSISSKLDRVLRCDIDDTELRQGRQTHASPTVSDEVQEGSHERNETTICEQSVSNSSHSVLTNAKTDVALAVGGRLQIGNLADASQIGGGKIGGSAYHLRAGVNHLAQALGRVLTSGSCGRVRGVLGKLSEGVSGKLRSETAFDFFTFLGVSGFVLGEEGFPMGALLVTALAASAIEILDVLRDKEGLVRYLKFGLDGGNVCNTQRSTVSAGEALLPRAITDSRANLDKSWEVGADLSLRNGGGDCLAVGVTVFDGENLPAISFVPLADILGLVD